MSQNTTREMLLKMRERYRRRGREGRSRLIDEVCEMCGYERKHAIKVLGGKLPVAGAEKASRGGPRCRYGDAERQVLKVIWMASEQPCGKRLKALVGLWLSHYEAERGSLEPGLRGRVLSPSAATMDRLLAPCRVALGSRRRCGTREWRRLDRSRQSLEHLRPRRRCLQQLQALTLANELSFAARDGTPCCFVGFQAATKREG